MVVYANAKILNWKQFTTKSASNITWLSCLCKCKDTKLKAIHNKKLKKNKLLLVVYANAKILNWKQFTIFFITLYSIRCYCDCSLGFYSVFCIVGEWFYMKDLLKFLFCLISKTYFYSFLIRNWDETQRKNWKCLKFFQK